jgi:antirestriction protein ArdC
MGTDRQPRHRPGSLVRQGEKGAPVVFWKTFEIDPEEENEETETRILAQYSTVFNADQVSGFKIIPQEHRQLIERNTRRWLYSGYRSRYSPWIRKTHARGRTMYVSAP